MRFATDFVSGVTYLGPRELILLQSSSTVLLNQNYSITSPESIPKALLPTSRQIGVHKDQETTK